MINKLLKYTLATILLSMLFTSIFTGVKASTSVSLTVSNSPQATNTPEPTTNTTSPSGGFNCTDPKPSSAPTIFVAYSDSPYSIVINYTPVLNNISDYVIEYGTKTGEYKYAQGNISKNGNNEYKINYLIPSTKYYIRLRAGNGCATGDWSNEISANTKSVSIFKSDNTGKVTLDLPAVVETDTKPTSNTVVDKMVTTKSIEVPKTTTINISIRIVDKNNRPIVGAKVTLYSDPKVTYTDENGNAFFNGVETGQHRVVVDYEGFQSEQSVFLNSSYNDATITLQGESSKNVFQNKILIYLALGVLIIIIAIIFIKKNIKN